MCGIAGLVLPAGGRADPEVVRRLADAVAHRGPDSSGAWVDGNVGLGHRRLSIIDTSSAADQPLGNEDGSVVVTFNGEIYNFQQLVPELEARGHRFVTRSDTEVLVHGWEEWGEGLLDRLRGMFALALFDRRRRLLLLARDRIGKKPLYWAQTPRGLVFGSEIMAVLAWAVAGGGVGRELDLAALGAAMVYGSVAEPRTAYAAVRALPPGSLMLVDAAAARPQPEIRRWWRFEPRPEPGLDTEEWLDAVDAELREAVRLRMIADVPLGAFPRVIKRTSREMVVSISASSR
jgi:asparagine synthase (glutamine-hydrolysing)